MPQLLTQCSHINSLTVHTISTFLSPFTIELSSLQSDPKTLPSLSLPPSLPRLSLSPREADSLMPPWRRVRLPWIIEQHGVYGGPPPLDHHSYPALSLSQPRSSPVWPLPVPVHLWHLPSVNCSFLKVPVISFLFPFSSICSFSSFPKVLICVS